MVQAERTALDEPRHERHMATGRPMTPTYGFGAGLHRQSPASVVLSLASYDGLGTPAWTPLATSRERRQLHDADDRLHGRPGLVAAGYTGRGVDVARIDSGVSPSRELKTAGKVIYGPACHSSPRHIT